MKPPGTLVSLTYDTPDDVEPGDFIRTGTGRTYLVDSVRLVRSTVVTCNRWAVGAVVMPVGIVLAPDAVVHPLRWHDRSRA